MGSSDVTVVQIRQRIDYEKLFTEFCGQLQGHGNERMAFCVFHENTDTPALSINLTEGIFHCKNPGCDKKGDVFTFYQRVRSITFREAVSELARRCGIADPDASTVGPKPKADIIAINAANDELLAAFAEGQSLVLLAQPTPPPESPKEEDRVIDELIVEGMHCNLAGRPAQIDFLQSRRGLTQETIDKFQVGHDGQRYFIPIRDTEGRCVNIRRYRPEAKSADKMLSWRPGFGQARLFPINLLNDERPIVLLEGEMDCMLARQLGLNALTTTGGAGTWSEKWNSLFTDKDLVICYDADDAGRKGATAIANKIGATARAIKVVQIPLNEPPGADFTDYIVGHGHTVDEFLQLVKETPRFQPNEATATLAGLEPANVHLSQASKAEYHNMPVRFNVMVSGKTTSPYIIPREVKAFCPIEVRGSMDMCKRCPVGKANAPVTSELKFESNDVLLFTNTTDAILKRAVKSQVGIPSKCNYAKHDVLKAMNVEEVQLIPEVERTDAEAPYVTTSAYYLGHGLQANRSYVMTGITVPEPKKQLATHIINSAVQSQSNIDAFRLTNDVVERLKIFQPILRGMKGLWLQYGNICEDLERYTRIYQRRDLMLAVDLVFHSVLQFHFQGERLKRGWTEALIIGDSRTGKTTVVERILDYYGAGEFSTGENTTLAGLVGGLHNVGTSWALQWGRIPLNDGRLLAIDEAGNLPPEQIARMSSMRSSGVAEVIKVHTERTNARTRMVWISNPRSPRPLSSFSQGVLAVKELIGAPEDIARFDIVVSAASGDVPLAIVNASRSQELTQQFTSDLCHQRVMWAWSRKAEQVIWDAEATEFVLRLATEQGERYRYATEIPLVEPNEQRVKLARLSVAVAVLFFSASDDGEQVIIKADHVAFAAHFLETLYNKPSLSFAEYARQQRARYVISQEGAVEAIIRKAPHAAAAFMEQEQFNQRDLQEILAVSDRDEMRKNITALRDAGFLKRQGTSFYQKTPAAIRWLRTELASGTTAEQTDFIELMEPAMPDTPPF